MRRQLILIAACALVAAPALALDMPARKAGLWELKMSFEQPKLPAHVIRQCTDAASDKLMNSNFGGALLTNSPPMPGVPAYRRAAGVRLSA